MTWRLAHEGHELTLEEGDAKRSSVVAVDGDVVSEETADWWSPSVHEVELPGGEDDVTPLRIEVAWDWRNRIDTARLQRDGDDEGLDLEPPPGSRAARREALRRDHPVRFTLMSVGVAAAQVLIGVLGVGALVSAFVRGLLPRISWDWLPDLPDLPSIDWPDWLRYLDPGHWLAKVPWPDLPDLPQLLPDWLTDSTKYWVPLVVAALVAINEVQKRRRQDAERGTRGDEQDDRPDQSPS